MKGTKIATASFLKKVSLNLKTTKMLKSISQLFVKRLSLNGVFVQIINVPLLIFGISALLTGSTLRQAVKQKEKNFQIELIETTSLIFMAIAKFGCFN